MAIQVPIRQLFINGEWREPVLKKRIPIINPATEEILGCFLLSALLMFFPSVMVSNVRLTTTSDFGNDSGNIPAATAEDVELAVEAAHKAFYRNKGRDWAFTSGAVRAKYLRAIAAKVTLIDLTLLSNLWFFSAKYYLL